MRRCAVETCPNPVRARGWCVGHYTRWLRTGDIRADEPLRNKPKEDTCTIDACTDPPFARGWCEMHYKRWRSHGDPRAEEPKRGTVRRLCTVETCRHPVDARGLCHGHYQRVLRHGDPMPELPLERRKQPATCTVEGCPRDSNSKGLCRTHRHRQRTYGDVRAAVPIRVAEGKGWISHGYRCVPVPPELLHLTNGETQIAEHRLLMAMYLDRPLERDEVVHHINGVRTDNRIENLELWSTAHPKGQRIDDKVRFAVEILRRYAPALLEEVA